MKIKLYIVTYKGFDRLNKTLKTLFSSDLIKHKHEINIINNHTEIKIDPEYQKKITILHNNLRPDFSNGHLSRNWNQAIINGFKDLNNPNCDILCHAQDDCIFASNFISKLIDIHKKYSFVQFGEGDQFCSYLPEAIKKIGLWDERFCAISLQAEDYFMRAVINNRKKTMINDWAHKRLWNNYEKNFFIVKPFNRQEIKQHGQHFLMLAKTFFVHKWGHKPLTWDKKFTKRLHKKPKVPCYIFYPYFEKNVENLIEKGYVVDNAKPIDVAPPRKKIQETLQSKLKRKIKYIVKNKKF